MQRGRVSTRARGRRGRGRGGVASAPSRSNTTDAGPSPTAAFSETLHFITSVKLEELEKQRTAYEEHAGVIQTARAHGDSSIGRVESLARAVRDWPGYGHDASSASSLIGGKLDLDNLDLWLAQARVDPNVSPAQLKTWGDTLEAHIRRISNSFDYAKLFGNLFTEWLSSGDEVSTVAAPDGDEGSEEFTEVGRKEAHEQRAELEARVFAEREIDVPALEAYLNELFVESAKDEGDVRTKQVELALKTLRESTKRFGENLRRSRISVTELKSIIDGLLREDLLDNQKRTTLKEFSINDTALGEITSVLNMYIARISTWEWPKEGVVIEMRRALNGKYRFYLQEEILLALFLHYVGVRWEVHLKQTLRSFVVSVFKPASTPATRTELERRRVFLGEDGTDDTIEKLRNTQARSEFFLTQLADSIRSTTSYDDGGDDKTGAASMKQRLLDLMTTESLIARAFHGSQSILVSDLEWFGPSLPFDSILTVLKFFGVDDDWLHFFRRFLAIPLRFKGDPVGTEPRVRVCGVPIGHRLSTFFGESILFVMDFAVNQRANGLVLYRIFDDLQMWDHDPARVLAGWQEMQRYAQLVGLKFNEGKTGSVTVGSGSHPEGLPRGDVRWGFLRLDASAGKFVVDEAQIDEHITELRRQISGTRSIFGLVNAFNHYIRFIVRNLGGRPANCFGASHLDAMIETVSRVQRSAFPDSEGAALGHIRGLLKERFGVDDVPLGWFFLPNALGGLGLHDPLVELLAIRKEIMKNPPTMIQESFDEDRLLLESHRTSWEVRGGWEARGGWATPPKKGDEKYKSWDMTIEEFESGREKFSAEWASRYSALLNYEAPHNIDATPDVETAINVLAGWPGHDFSPYSDWDGKIGFYYKWIIALYCDEIVQRFGSLAVVDPALIPVSMLELFRGVKIRWQQ